MLATSEEARRSPETDLATKVLFKFEQPVSCVGLFVGAYDLLEVEYHPLATRGMFAS